MKASKYQSDTDDEKEKVSVQYKNPPTLKTNKKERVFCPGVYKTTKIQFGEALKMLPREMADVPALETVKVRLL